MMCTGLRSIVWCFNECIWDKKTVGVSSCENLIDEPWFSVAC